MKLASKYYIDFSEDGQKIIQGDLGPLDDDGIPLVDYNIRYAAAGLPFPKSGEFGLHYTPVTVSILALSLFDQISSKFSSSVADVKFLHLADWLLASLKPINESCSVWQHHFMIPFEAGISTPYASGIAQGLGISTLLRAFELSKKERYLHAATRAFNSYYINIENGGVRTIDKGYVWIEEWPSNPRSHVLNGFMYSIISMHDYISILECSQAKELFASTLDTLEMHIEQYDAKYGSRYDLLRRLVVSEGYHRLHINLLRSIHSISGRKIFLDVAEEWSNYLFQYSSIHRRVMGFSENVYKNSEYRACKARQIFRKIIG